MKAHSTDSGQETTVMRSRLCSEEADVFEAGRASMRAFELCAPQQPHACAKLRILERWGTDKTPWSQTD